ncbi:ImmA/IrrE family metallo-endopeptidase [Listeria booriae]|uniref:ImmA/IrrE family metallo-endopeptidase n=1 Tax=Listeria booriae TaxID=1552123 RepID=UPI001624971F|nr:ImmA/IrrE family metallo-endopeptidase [Listeria booriae]MBC1524471.1 ImmA/IrrE family metallo-endopeptidase [Listeria booriae]MBC6306449.1 ImmA/IrrE family metallo-endopeptidase [Listeria booriae]
MNIPQNASLLGNDKAEIMLDEFNISPSKFRADSFLMLIIHEFEIRFKTIDISSTDFCGVMINSTNQFFIFVNSNLAPPRRNFTIAHEISHIFLHRDSSSFFENNSTIGEHTLLNNETQIEEVEANAYAASLICPGSVLIHLIEMQCSFKRIASKTQISYETLYWRIYNILVNINGMERKRAIHILENFRNNTPGNENISDVIRKRVSHNLFI